MFSFKDVFILINFSPHFFFICTYTVWHNYTCMCAVALCSIPTARVVHVEFFCEVSFVFYLWQWDVCWLTTSSWSGDLAFLFCWADSFSVILFSLSQCPWLYIALLFQVQVNHDINLIVGIIIIMYKQKRIRSLRSFEFSVYNVMQVDNVFYIKGCTRLQLQ